MDTSDVSYEDLVKDIVNVNFEGKITTVLQYLANNVTYLQQAKNQLIMTINNIDKIPNAYDTIDALLGKIKKVSRDLNTNVTSIDEEIARQVYYNTFPEIKISTDNIL